MTTCDSCADYLARRRPVLLPLVGRWVTRQKHDTPPSRIVSRLIDEHHRRHCADT